MKTRNNHGTINDLTCVTHTVITPSKLTKIKREKYAKTQTQNYKNKIKMVHAKQPTYTIKTNTCASEKIASNDAHTCNIYACECLPLLMLINDTNGHQI